MKQNLQGIDVSIEISLKEYGTAWIEGPTETRFYYGIRSDDSIGFNHFDSGNFRNDIDFKKEFSWINEDDWNSFLSTYDTTWEEWNNFPMPQKISDLNSYYGYENIFGSSYHSQPMTYKDVRFQANSIRID